jgi:hypothetical protein
MPASLDDPRVDWPLRSALLTYRAVTPEMWTRYWRASETHRQEPWAVSMQERLLWRATEMTPLGRSLPQGFPLRAAAPTQLWAMLRLVALVQAGDVAGAFAQADSTIDSSGTVAAIRIRLDLMRNQWGRALRIAVDTAPASLYLVRVLAPPDVVDSLAADARSKFATEGRLTRAGRLAAAGDWRGASRAASGIRGQLPQRWARTAVLAADTTQRGRLAFARWLRDRNGQLFFGENTFWLRGLNWRRNALARDTTGSREPPPLDPRLPWSPEDERAKIAAHFESTTELYYSLRAYAKWLDGATAGTPGLAAVVRESNQVYNRLINWDATNSAFWSETLASSPEARSIRRAGALLRRR